MGKFPNRSGLTIIELITSLVLFVMIFGMLMAVVRIAVNLWTPDQSDSQLQARGDTVMDVLANDFYQAVADNGATFPNAKTNDPCFVLDCNTNTLANTTVPQIVLYFARQASPTTPLTRGSPDQRNALDAVFYVCYSNCLSRHIYPLVRGTWKDNSETLSDLLSAARNELDSGLPGIYAWFRSTGGVASPDWGSHSLLASRCNFAALATLPPEMLKNPFSDPEPLVRFDQCEAYVVPDFLDAALILYDEAEWNTLNTPPPASETTEETGLKRAFLGKQFSKRMAYPAKGGARL